MSYRSTTDTHDGAVAVLTPEEKEQQQACPEPFHYRDRVPHCPPVPKTKARGPGWQAVDDEC